MIILTNFLQELDLVHDSSILVHDLLVPDGVFVERLENLFAQWFKVIAHVSDFMVVVFVILDAESSNNTFDLLDVLESTVFPVPVIHHESQLILHFDLLWHLSSFAKCLSHDSDQHICQMDEHQKRYEEVQNV